MLGQINGKSAMGGEKAKFLCPFCFQGRNTEAAEFLRDLRAEIFVIEDHAEKPARRGMKLGSGLGRNIWR
jgi:hypothetical protein